MVQPCAEPLAKRLLAARCEGTTVTRMAKRDTNYPHQISVQLSDAQYDALRAAADAADRAVAAVARDAIARGLPLVREAERRAKRRRG